MLAAYNKQASFLHPISRGRVPCMNADVATESPDEAATAYRDRHDSPTYVSRGKAAVLTELRAAGFNVPEFVIAPVDLAAAAEQLGYPLAVRSSASLEDGRTASFAGQFRSFLGIRSLSELEDAVAQCRASLYAPSVHDYCRRHDVDAAQLRMDVIVQRMIEPELAGVAFTVNPLTGTEEVVIEACLGLGDALLDGRASPLPADHLLLKQYAPMIAEVARKIMRYLGAPKDIEFAVADGNLFVLQARPITRIGFTTEIGEWTNADFRDGGVSSRVCSPLMWSLYHFIWEHTLKGSLRRLRLLDGDFQAARLFFGRPYWNLGAVKACVGRLPGFVEREFDADLSVPVTYTGDGQCTPTNFFGLLRAIPTILAIGAFFRQQEREARSYLESRFDAIESRYEPLIRSQRERPADVRSVFRTLIEQDYLAVESCYFNTIFALSFAKLDFKSSFPDADYASLVAALPPLRHMAPMRAMRTMAVEKERDLAALLRQFRHHSRLGLDVIAPRWDEDRAYVETLFNHLPESASVDPAPHYENARAEALAKISFWRRPSFHRKLDRLRTFVWLREEMRDLSSRMYYLIRRLALELARQHDLVDDVFFMSFREIFALDRTQAPKNREIYDSYRHFAAPNEIGARYTHSPDAITTDALRGIGASPGIARGIARIARSVREAMTAEPGAILVCPFTDPGWIPVLDRVAAVVTENGGLLSHAAVICREFGIPAVLGVPSALERIRDGQTIIVHGGQGLVELVKAESRK
jgi:phosphohistidine swiveling domain-containing protein